MPRTFNLVSRVAPNAPNAPNGYLPHRIVSLTFLIDNYALGAIGANGGERTLFGRYLYRTGKFTEARAAYRRGYGAAPGRYFPRFAPLTPCFSYERPRPTDSKPPGMGRKLLILLRAAWPRDKNPCLLGLGPFNFQAVARY